MEKTELRIVAGDLRGRKLTVMVHEGLRPTPQRVRESLFSILGNAVPGRPFIDLFAGTGVNGLEAVSRGASRATLIEKDPKAAATIVRHVEKFDVADRVQVLRADVYRWAERWLAPKEPVNVFVSPPFPDLTGASLDEFMALMRKLVEKVPAESVVVLQAEDNFPDAELPHPGAWDKRVYGRNMMLFWVAPGAEPVQAGVAESSDL
jgi:16S rRNA (guanine966-N2)-methyltransferase